jgi:hypothetical protein
MHEALRSMRWCICHKYREPDATQIACNDQLSFWKAPEHHFGFRAYAIAKREWQQADYPQRVSASFNK